MMQSLDKDLRSALEKTVKAARTVAETAANAAVNQLGVGHDKPEAFLSDSEKVLRNRLRTHGKQLGDVRDSNSTNPTYGKQEVQHLVQEVAYQHWHRMLFARFLADNNLLMYDGVAVTVEECDELAPDEGAKSGWELAGKLAARMLPQVFKPGSPVFELSFAPEHQSELELLLKALPDAVFKASDSLGWVYQFWQADNKERINKSEVKIGADELPAVTQLFTEPYMVAFLLHNSLGAWWAVRHPGTPCPIKLDYLRTLDDGTPAAGKFEGWPDSLASFKLIDPCCGSGHFLVAAFMMLVPMRMAAEGLSAKEAVNRVLAENIHGLEIDPRCVEIAVFAVALEAWRYPDMSGRPLGVREIPSPHIACCGLKVAAKAQDWEALVPSDSPNVQDLRSGLIRLHETFSTANLLGSLLDPRKTQKGDLFSADYEALRPWLLEALKGETVGNQTDDIWDLALTARGLLDAAQLLNMRYHLVITNVPYLARGKHSEDLKVFCDENYSEAKYELANVFLDRCLELCLPNGNGSTQVVMPLNWLYQARLTGQRLRLLQTATWQLAIKLGTGAFESISGEVVNAMLISMSSGVPNPKSTLVQIDLSSSKNTEKKREALTSHALQIRQQIEFLNSADGIVSFSTANSNFKLLENYFISMRGIVTGDNELWLRKFWEVRSCDRWKHLQSTPDEQSMYCGRSTVIDWATGGFGMLRPGTENNAYGKHGVTVSRMSGLRSTLYSGELYEQTVTTLVPSDKQHEHLVSALYCFTDSFEFSKAVRDINANLNVTNSIFLKIQFDVDRWKQEALERFPDGLPKVYSDDPTQWVFHGHPKASAYPLQVAVARLVGYHWPAESDEHLDLSNESRNWISRNKSLASHADKDGIVCIPAVGRELSASDRLLNLLAEAYGTDWSNDMLGQLLTAADHAGKSLETWLRDKFFQQHCALYGSRPFVWHVWDGLSDGFSALVNYHKLDFKTLESLIYTYLGDWIGRQKRDANSGVDGANEKLAAAEALKTRLELILAGEAPYDIFVRWKKLEDQPAGWNPDLNDGVRMNIRPFISVPDVGKRGAGVLREKPNIKWDKDRGSDGPSAPWYELGLQYSGKRGDRINDHHLSLAQKRKAQEKDK